jgi:HAD superfamily hydrolase (TIGR01484 family)
MIKMIASDMDGTLLSSHLAISETNKEAVLEAQAQGIEFMVATGRAYSEAKPALDDAGIKCCMKMEKLLLPFQLTKKQQKKL